MPGRGTTRHAIRIPDPLWRAALAKARDRGDELSAVIRRALEAYVRDEGPESPSKP